MANLLPQLPPGDLDQFFDIRFLAGAGDVGKEVANLVAGDVDRRHDHMRRALMAELDDPLAEIGLGHLEPLVFQGVVEQGLLGGHRLRFDDFFRAGLLSDPGDDIVGRGTIAGEMDPHAGSLGVSAELVVQLHQAGQQAVRGGGDLGHQALHVDLGEGLGPVSPIGDGEGVERPAQVGVVQRFLYFFAVFLEIPSVLHISPPAAVCAVQAVRAHPGRGPARYRRSGWPR